MGFIEVGISDFFVPHGYGHIIDNLCGTGGYGVCLAFLTFGNERHDMFDAVFNGVEGPQ